MNTVLDSIYIVVLLQCPLPALLSSFAHDVLLARLRGSAQLFSPRLALNVARPEEVWDDATRRTDGWMEERMDRVNDEDDGAPVLL